MPIFHFLYLIHLTQDQDFHLLNYLSLGEIVNRYDPLEVYPNLPNPCLHVPQNNRKISNFYDGAISVTIYHFDGLSYRCGIDLLNLAVS